MESYYSEKNRVIAVSKNKSESWNVEYFTIVNSIESEKLLFNLDLSGKDVLQLVLRNTLTGKIIIVEDEFKTITKRILDKEYSKTDDPFVEHWWLKILKPSIVDNNGQSNVRYAYDEYDFDSYYSTRYDLGGGYWAEYYIKVEQSQYFSNLSGIGSETTDKVAFTIVDEQTTTNYWGYDDLKVTPLQVKNVSGKISLSASYGTDIRDEFLKTEWYGTYYEEASSDISIGASIGKIVNLSISYSLSPTNPRNGTIYLFPSSFRPVGGYKMTFPKVLDKIGDQYVIEVIKNRFGSKSEDYFLESHFSFDYGMSYGSGSLDSGFTFTIGEYQ